MRLSRLGEVDRDRGGVSASGMTPERSASSKVVRVVSMSGLMVGGLEGSTVCSLLFSFSATEDQGGESSTVRRGD